MITQRVKENMLSAEKCDASPLYALRKDYKPYDDEKVGPQLGPCVARRPRTTASCRICLACFKERENT